MKYFLGFAFLVAMMTGCVESNNFNDGDFLNEAISRFESQDKLNLPDNASLDEFREIFQKDTGFEINGTYEKDNYVVWTLTADPSRKNGIYKYCNYVIIDKVRRTYACFILAKC